jgi:hypothetical protein
VTAAGLGRRVRFVELTVDPGRDTPARLRAYRALVGAPSNWALLTGRPGVIERTWQYFGVWYQRVAEGRPPGTDWLTGKPLNYDVTHQDVLIYLDASGRERFVVVGAPNASGAPVAPALRRFLSAQGRAELSHPDASTWTPAVSVPPGPGRSAVALTVMGPTRAVTATVPGAGAVPARPASSNPAPASVHPMRRTPGPGIFTG